MIMVMLVVAALYVMGGLVFLVSLLALTGMVSELPRAGIAPPLIGSGIMLGLAAIAHSLERIVARLK
jgi:hypothetical protein